MPISLVRVGPGDIYLFKSISGQIVLSLAPEKRKLCSRYLRSFLQKNRVSHADRDRWLLRKQGHFPDLLEVAPIDPPVSILSEEIVDVLQPYFQPVEFNSTGGTLWQFMLLEVAGDFSEKAPEPMRVLQLIFDIEEVLVSSSDLRP